jgi:hypothetical protein
VAFSVGGLVESNIAATVFVLMFLRRVQVFHTWVSISWGPGRETVRRMARNRREISKLPKSVRVESASATNESAQFLFTFLIRI